MELSKALQDIAAERQRQVLQEGWLPDHDDEHSGGELAIAGACYALFAACTDDQRESTDLPDGLSTTGEKVEGWAALSSLWPWARKWWKPTDRRRDLVKAGALIAAEIERLDRISYGKR